jgi:hypothetical protein
MNNNRQSILELDFKEVKNFFLNGGKYCATPLPRYFKFEPLLKALNDYYDKNLKKEYSEEIVSKAKKQSDVNYKLIVNKDGTYAWRKLEIIHPFLYVCLVNLLVENWEELQKLFKKFNEDKKDKIICMSVSINEEKKHTKETILNWWKTVEQETIIQS